MKRTIVTIVALLCCGWAMGQQRMENATYFGHIYLQTMIDGHMANLAFDTGSPYLCLDSTYQADSGYAYKNVIDAKMDGAGNNSASVKAIVNEATYTLAGHTYTTKVAPIVSLKPILGDYADGILGLSELGGKVIAIDFARGKIGFWERLGTSDIEGYTSIPIRFEGMRIFVELKVTVSNGKSIEGAGMIDLGSGEAVTLTSAVVESHKLNDITPSIHYSLSNGGIGGESSGCEFRADQVDIGPFSLKEVTMDFSYNTGGALATDNYIGIIGNNIWERFDMIIDLNGEKLYLKPNEKYNKPFEAPTLGFIYTDRSRTLGCWVVNGLFSGSNAEKAGLKQGDRIVAVSDRSVKEMDIVEQRSCFDNMTTIQLTVLRDGKKEVITFTKDEPRF